MSLLSRLTGGRFGAWERDTSFDLPTTQMLMRFGGEQAVERWVLASDKEYYGLSSSTLAPASPESMAWTGTTSLALSPNAKKPLPRMTGWCAMRAHVESEEWNLMDFDGLCLRARPDGRRYVLNVRAAGLLGDARIDDLNQAILPLVEDRPKAVDQSGGGAAVSRGTGMLLERSESPLVSDDPYSDSEDMSAQARAEADELSGRGGDVPPLRREISEASDAFRDEAGWVNYRVPFGAMRLTHRGRVERLQTAMNLTRITHVGLLMADGGSGEFGLELESLSAFRYTEDEMHLPHVQQALELNRVIGYLDEDR